MLVDYPVALVIWIGGHDTAAEIDSWRLPHTRLPWGLTLHDDGKALSGALHTAILGSLVAIGRKRMS